MTVVQHLAPMGYFDKTVEHDAVAEVTGASLRYADVGSGEPVILIHGTSLADGVATPLRHYDPLYDDFRILSYYRAGYSGSLLHQEGCSIELGAQHIVELLDHVGVDRAHMVAFSAGGVMGLEALMRYPDRFATAVLLEPWLPREDPVAVEAVNTAGMTAYGKFAEGDLPGAARYWLEAVGGTSFLSCIDVYGPKDVWKRVEADLAPTFYIDAAALGAWGFTPSKAVEYADRKPMMPILNVLAHDSEAILPGFRETFRFLLEWLPHAERAGIPNATHGMQTMNPLAVGALIHDFLSRHPISSGA